MAPGASLRGAFWSRVGFPSGACLQELLTHAKPTAEQTFEKEYLIRDLQEKIEDAVPAGAAFCLVGSAAKQTALRTSDIDILVMLPDDIAEEDVQNAARNVEKRLHELGATWLRLPGARSRSFCFKLFGYQWDMHVRRKIDTTTHSHNDFVADLPAVAKDAVILLKLWLRGDFRPSFLVELLVKSVYDQSAAPRPDVISFMISTMRTLVGWRRLQLTWKHDASSWRRHHKSPYPLVLDPCDALVDISKDVMMEKWEYMEKLCQESIRGRAT